jgi:hypothetical protein
MSIDASPMIQSKPTTVPNTAYDWSNSFTSLQYAKSYNQNDYLAGQEAVAFRKKQGLQRGYSNQFGSNFTSGNNTPSKVTTPKMFNTDELQTHLLNRKNSTFAAGATRGY